MSVGLLGEKYGCTRVFDENGTSILVTVLGVSPSFVSQLKTDEIDGYTAIQLTTGSKKKLTQPLQGHLKKAGLASARYVYEIRVLPDHLADYNLAQELTVENFLAVSHVHVSARTKGKGYQGCVKRHNFSMQDATHGNSLSHRASGSIGQCQDPGRVFRGKKMAGRMGNVNCTVRNLAVIRVDVEKGFMLVKGAVPGPKGARVLVMPIESNIE